MKREAVEEDGSLRSFFGKAAALLSVAATFAFYATGFQIGRAYYQQWQDNKAASASGSWSYDEHARTRDLPWGEAAGTLGVSLASGFTGIALGRSRRRYGGNYYYGSSFSGGGNDDGFWLGYMLGSSGRSGGRGGYSSGSSSKNNGGAAAAIVIVGAVALAASASVVSYKAVKANFSANKY